MSWLEGCTEAKRKLPVSVMNPQYRHEAKSGIQRRFHVPSLKKAVNQLARASRGGVGQHDVREGLGLLVMVHHHHGAVFVGAGLFHGVGQSPSTRRRVVVQAKQHVRPGHQGADRVGLSVVKTHRFLARHPMQEFGIGVRHDHRRRHLPSWQRMLQGQRRPNGVAIWRPVRRDDHPTSADATCAFNATTSSRANTSSMRERYICTMAEFMGNAP